MKVVINAGSEDELMAKVDEYLETRLGPAIEGDAKRYAPKRTGRLAESIEHHMEGHTLIIDADAPYAVYVELGHRVAHGPGMREVGPKVVAPQPYLRAALLQEREQ